MHFFTEQPYSYEEESKGETLFASQLSGRSAEAIEGHGFDGVFVVHG